MAIQSIVLTIHYFKQCSTCWLYIFNRNKNMKSGHMAISTNIYSNGLFVYGTQQAQATPAGTDER